MFFIRSNEEEKEVGEEEEEDGLVFGYSGW